MLEIYKNKKKKVKMTAVQITNETIIEFNRQDQVNLILSIAKINSTYPFLMLAIMISNGFTGHFIT